MGISYNPSSFNSNKTILQAIEEIKKYLITNPLACIYELNDDALGGGPYALSSIVNPNSQEIKLGDIVLSTDGFYGFIQTIGTTDFTVRWYQLSAKIDSVSVSSTTGAWKTITAGANVIFRLNPDNLNPLRYQRANGYQIDLQYSDVEGTHNQTYNVGTEIVSAIWSIEDPITHDTTIYIDVLDNEGTSLINTIVIPAGASGPAGVSVVSATIDASNHLILTLSDSTTIDAGLVAGLTEVKASDVNSETATNGQVLTANGSGGASWENASGGAVEGTSVLSTGETSGKVLTADGSGGASWQTAGGGSLYLHTINFNATSGTKSLSVCFSLITNSSAQLTTYVGILVAFNNNPHYELANGKYIDTSNNINAVVVRIGETANDTFRFQYVSLGSSDYTFTTESLPSTSFTATDRVIQIL